VSSYRQKGDGSRQDGSMSCDREGGHLVWGWGGGLGGGGGVGFKEWREVRG